MAHQPEDKKPDLSSFPRGAIGSKGLPVGRNARLPSIRTPRDLTLGAQPKRTFVPNIPVRREKRPSNKETESSGPAIPKPRPKDIVVKNERGRGRGKANVIQTDGSVFGEGVAALSITPKVKNRESASRTGLSPSKAVKKDKHETIASYVHNKEDLFDDESFIDYIESEIPTETPLIFPLEEGIKTGIKSENNDVKYDIKKNFDEQNFEKGENFNIEQIARFIKKEVDCDEKETTSSVKKDTQLEKLPNFLSSDPSQLFILKFPKCMPSDSERNSDKRTDTKTSNDKVCLSSSLSSLPEGCIGKLQMLKSGRVRMLIGSLSFDYDSERLLNGKFEIANVRTNGEFGDMTVLGNAKQKHVFVPDIDNLSNF